MIYKKKKKNRTRKLRNNNTNNNAYTYHYFPIKDTIALVNKPVCFSCFVPCWSFQIKLESSSIQYPKGNSRNANNVCTSNRGRERQKQLNTQSNTAAAAFVETQILTGYDSRNSNHE